MKRQIEITFPQLDEDSNKVHNPLCEDYMQLVIMLKDKNVN